MRSYRAKVGRFIQSCLETYFPWVIGYQRWEEPYVFQGIKVGDRFKSRLAYTYAMEGVLTVTELTEQGFKYTCEKPHDIYPTRWGPSLVEGGELLINSSEHLKSMWNAQYERVA